MRPVRERVIRIPELSPETCRLIGGDLDRDGFCNLRVREFEDGTAEVVKAVITEPIPKEETKG